VTIAPLANNSADINFCDENVLLLLVINNVLSTK